MPLPPPRARRMQRRIRSFYEYSFNHKPLLEVEHMMSELSTALQVVMPLPSPSPRPPPFMPLPSPPLAPPFHAPCPLCVPSSFTSPPPASSLLATDPPSHERHARSRPWHSGGAGRESVRPLPVGLPAAAGQVHQVLFGVDRAEAAALLRHPQRVHPVRRATRRRPAPHTPPSPAPRLTFRPDQGRPL